MGWVGLGWGEWREEERGGVRRGEGNEGVGVWVGREEEGGVCVWEWVGGWVVGEGEEEGEGVVVVVVVVQTRC